MPSPAPKSRQEIQEIPINLAGGNKFGRYPKINQEQTWNMIVSDGALVDYAGYKNVKEVTPTIPGRGIYASSRANLLFAVWGTSFYSINSSLQTNFHGDLLTSEGDIFISENNNAEIAITDGSNLYVYNYLTNSFKTSITSGSPSSTQFLVPFSNPGYISFQNGALIVANNNTTNWYLSSPNDATSWPSTSPFVGSLQTKPDTVQAVVPTPGGGNTVVVFGRTVTEQWHYTAQALFPYQRSNTFNVDYGCLNASSIASLDNYVVWLAANEQSGATLMVYSGNQAQSISTDGMDFKFSKLTNPSNCTGFLFRQDGHVLYQFTFPDDNLSYVYDFNSKLFSTVSDENNDYHIARNVVFFNNDYYFVSLKGGNLYEFGTQYTNFQYAADNIQQMPRLRVFSPVRLPSQRMFIIKSLGFTIENGRPNDMQTFEHIEYSNALLATEGLVDITTENDVFIATNDGEESVSNTYVLDSECVDLSISRDGGETFGSSLRLNMNAVGKRKSRFIYQRLGQANDATFQLKFIGYGRFVCFDGLIEAYQ